MGVWAVFRPRAIATLLTVVAYILYACDPAMFGPAARAVRATVARLRANIVAPAR